MPVDMVAWRVAGLGLDSGKASYPSHTVLPTPNPPFYQLSSPILPGFLAFPPSVPLFPLVTGSLLNCIFPFDIFLFYHAFLFSYHRLSLSFFLYGTHGGIFVLCFVDW